MSRIRCYRPNSCGVTFHVTGTSAARACQSAVRSLPQRPMLGYIESTPIPQASSSPLTDENGTLIMESDLIPPTPGSKALVRNGKTGETMRLVFLEGTRRIATSSVYRWKFYREDDPTNMKTMLWDSQNKEDSPYEVVEYI